MTCNLSTKTIILLVTSSLAACASGERQLAIAFDEPVPAVLAPEPEPAAPMIAVPEPLPLPGQMMPVEQEASAPEPRNPSVRVERANDAARIEPEGQGFVNAVQVYPYSEGALYQIYTAPGQVTDIALEPGEQLVGSGPVAAGDTVRWVIGDTTSGTGAAARVHILVKPTRSELRTNLVINTDRRTYHVELRANRTTYMASVSWSYPADALVALRGRTATEDDTAIAAAVDLASLHFRYEIEGDDPPWRPIRAYDDERQVFIEFPPGIAQGELPPLFVVGPEGDGAELVNYRVRDRFMIVDRLFAAAELRLGSARRQQIVRIVRTDARRR